MKIFLLALLPLCLIADVHAQNGFVRASRIVGLLEAKTYKNRLPNATVTLLNVKDSTIVKSTFSDMNGAFVLDALSHGQYDLHINYIGYQVVRRKIIILPNDTLIDLGVILMNEIGITLKTVEIVKERVPMAIRKDTLEFNASAFKMREHAAVEELLLRLPGIEIGSDGIIKVNGVVVKQLMIDGKPFSTSDPTIATWNLASDIIDKIQFIDKKSEWSQFAGVDEGRTVKTINLTIKKEMKSAFSGWGSTGFSTEAQFAVNGSLSKFKNDEQIAGFINGTNINGYQNKGEKSSVSIGGSSYIRSWNGTSVYNADINKKFKVRSTYSIVNRYTEDQKSSERQNLFPDTTWYYNGTSNSQVSSLKHNLNMDMTLAIDSLHMLNITATLNYLTGDNLHESFYTSLGGTQQLMNSSAVSNVATYKMPNLSATASFGKRLNKAGRTIRMNMGLEYNGNGQQSINKSRNYFVKPDGSTFTDTVDQKNNINRMSRYMAFLLIYTEPLTKGHSLEVNYGYTYNFDTSGRSAYYFNSTSKLYDRKNDSLSNSFLNKSLMQQASIMILGQKRKYNYALEMKLQHINQINDNISAHIKTKRNFLNILPSAVLNYSIDSIKELHFTFTGSTRQPSILERQPVLDISNPLYLLLGNPDLKPAFNGAFDVRYSAADPVSLRMFSVSLNSEFFVNKIVNASWFDSLGRQISKPLNTNGSFTINTSLSGDFPLKKQQMFLRTNISLGYVKDVSFINDERMNTRTLTIASSINYHYYNYEGLFDLNINFNSDYNAMQYAMQHGQASFLNCTFSFDSNIYLPGNITIGGNLIYKLNTRRPVGFDRSSAMLNAVISKKIFANKEGLVKLQGIDLLNRNVGISRAVGPNYIEDVQTKVVQRLFLLSFSYFMKSKRK